MVQFFFFSSTEELGIATVVIINVLNTALIKRIDTLQPVGPEKLNIPTSKWTDQSSVLPFGFASVAKPYAATSETSPLGPVLPREKPSRLIGWRYEVYTVSEFDVYMEKLFMEEVHKLLSLSVFPKVMPAGLFSGQQCPVSHTNTVSLLSIAGFRASSDCSMLVLDPAQLLRLGLIMHI